jgi:hypothetical protein
LIACVILRRAVSAVWEAETFLKSMAALRISTLTRDVVDTTLLSEKQHIRLLYQGGFNSSSVFLKNA